MATPISSRKYFQHEIEDGITAAEVDINAGPGCSGRTFNAAIEVGNDEIVTIALKVSVEVWLNDLGSKAVPLGSGYRIYTYPLKGLQRDISKTYTIDYHSLKRESFPPRMSHCLKTMSLHDAFIRGERNLFSRFEDAHVRR